ncbi:50S ribosomal protein L33 [Heyndrickxia acidicola]|uniref:Large ribosomal subunit protein bL33 n=1 Tax=Heyndrickxia acidicola TaxID=209389 RepID=A0ABU6MLV9_9BACI|nr:50S ribosomal protein L33 [Heyndrickxia acidicola]MED1205677.1 50S ribosomal protein L33 [Heyndrickxia acidicola]
MQKKIVLACSQCGTRNYSTAATKQSQTVRLEMNKFCKRCNAHSIHRETK